MLTGYFIFDMKSIILMLVFPSILYAYFEIKDGYTSLLIDRLPFRMFCNILFNVLSLVA